MIGYCPLEEVEPRPRPPPPMVQRQMHNRNTNMEDTECNYVVLFFIAGVLALAAMDAIKK